MNAPRWWEPSETCPKCGARVDDYGNCEPCRFYSTVEAEPEPKRKHKPSTIGQALKELLAKRRPPA